MTRYTYACQYGDGICRQNIQEPEIKEEFTIEEDYRGGARGGAIAGP